MSVFFTPFKGDNYDTKPFGGHRLLIFGESHYDEPGCPPCNANATIEVVRSHINRTHIKYLQYIYEICVGYDRPYTQEDFWQGVAFANFVQKSMAGVSERPDNHALQSSVPGFWEVLNLLRPDIVFVFSRTVWAALPNAAPGTPEPSSGLVNEMNWTWKYSDPAILAACFNHLSARHNLPVSVWKAWADRCWLTFSKALKGP